MAPIAICICTYNRPEGLKTALRSLDGQQLTALSEDQIVVIVVDNSAAGSAKAICDLYAENGRFAFRYVHQPAKGLVHARIACLAAAEQEQAVNMLFLDDDEAAAPSWVEALLGRLTQSGAAAAIGPVFPVFERAPSAWLPVHRFVIVQKKHIDRPFLLRGGEAGIAGVDKPLGRLMHIAEGEAAILRIGVADRPCRAARAVIDGDHDDLILAKRGQLLAVERAQRGFETLRPIIGANADCNRRHARVDPFAVSRPGAI